MKTNLLPWSSANRTGSFHGESTTRWLRQESPGKRVEGRGQWQHILKQSHGFGSPLNLDLFFLFLFNWFRQQLNFLSYGLTGLLTCLDINLNFSHPSWAGYFRPNQLLATVLRSILTLMIYGQVLSYAGAVVSVRFGRDISDIGYINRQVFGSDWFG